MDHPKVTITVYASCLFACILCFPLYASFWTDPHSLKRKMFIICTGYHKTLFTGFFLRIKSINHFGELTEYVRHMCLSNVMTCMIYSNKKYTYLPDAWRYTRRKMNVCLYLDKRFGHSDFTFFFCVPLRNVKTEN